MIASPSCYYNSTMECFITLGDNMVYSTELAEIYTSPPQLQDLIEICGTEGYIWLSAQIELDVNSAVNELIKIVQVKLCCCVKEFINTSFFLPSKTQVL